VRPLRLRMQAFGPYAGVQQLDFGDLGDHDFFLITGPTGSGKTTILDAMAFGLYGDTSGGDRDARDMRSQHAPPGLLTEVEFDFAVGHDLYRVHRRPQQVRPARRGEGLVAQPQEATLWSLKAEADGTLAAGKPLADGWTGVTKKTEDILGFRCEQFRQVVMLPQGRFQELLQAKSQDKEKILAALFDTSFYARVEIALKARAASIAKAHERLTVERAAVRGQAGVADDDDLAAQRVAGEEALAAAVATARARNDDLARAQRVLAEAQAVAARLDELAAARERAAHLAAQADRFAALRAELELAGRAASLAADDEAVRTSQHEVEQRARDLEAARDALARAEAVHAAAETRLAAEVARAPAREHAAEEARRLRGLEGKVAGIADLAGELEAAQASRDDAEAARARARSAATAADDRLAEASQRLQKARATAAGAAALVAVAGQAAATAAQRRALDDIAGRCESAAAGAATRTMHAAQADARYGAAVDELRRLETEWHAGQAARLAEALVAGEPCPVCGATEHPSPAQLTGGPPPSLDDLDAARATLDRLFAARDAANQALAAAQQQREQAAAQREHLAQTLGAAATLGVEACDRAAREASAAAETAADAAASVAALEIADSEALAARGEAAADLRAADEVAVAGRRAADALAARLAERLGDLPPELADPAALAAAIAAADAERLRLDDALEAARGAATAAAVDLEKARASAAHAEERRTAAVHAAATAVKRFAAHLATQGFADEAAWRAALREEERLPALSADLEEYDGDVLAVTAVLHQAERAAEGLRPPAVDDLRAAAAEALAGAEEAANMKAGVENRLRTLTHARGELDRIAAESRGLDDEYAVVGRIAQVATGDNPLRLNFQRFVLGVHLDRVLEIASLRLREMTARRYELERSGRAHGRSRAAGLDLDVFDAWTGESRPVSTLSGGESFLAALSLALGLAEAVQELSGGVHLDTILVDEGFGSLDAEALDQAVATLTTLRENGRLVGVISHLGELRERIDARLEVTAAETGSAARFVVP